MSKASQGPACVGGLRMPWLSMHVSVHHAGSGYEVPPSQHNRRKLQLEFCPSGAPRHVTCAVVPGQTVPVHTFARSESCLVP